MVMFRYNVQQRENAGAPKILFSGCQSFPFILKANVKRDCFIKARSHHRVIDRRRARWKPPVWRPMSVAMTGLESEKARREDGMRRRMVARDLHPCSPAPRRT